MLEARGLCKQFYDEKSKRTVVALDDIDLKVDDNDFIAIIGPSGCGKTTLLRSFAGLVDVSAGYMALNDVEITGPSPERAMVFQSFALMPWSDILTNVAYGLQLRGVGKKERRERARQLIDMVGLNGFESYLPGQLSGGMQQRVGLARALAVEPKVLLMDEPFGALDEQTKRVLWEQLLDIWETQRKTVVFVTHSMEEAVVLADKIVLMTNRPGRIKEIIDVDIPRPRPSNIENHPRYAEIKGHLWELLRVMHEEAEQNEVIQL